METQAKEQRERLASAEWARTLDDAYPVEPEPDAAPALLALTRCLNGLAPQEADFILSYYAQDGGAARIRHRHELAASLGLNENAARNRALRLRNRLETCVEHQLAAGPPVPPS
jgi:DNA-directed RNA polymerase specialized sigma24 family protein